MERRGDCRFCRVVTPQYAGQARVDRFQRPHISFREQRRKLLEGRSDGRHAFAIVSVWRSFPESHDSVAVRYRDDDIFVSGVSAAGDHEGVARAQAHDLMRELH